MEQGNNTLLKVGGVLALILLAGGKAVSNVNTNVQNPNASGTYPNHLSTVRGLRNNNPGNLINTSAVTYPGEIIPSGDPAFKQFKTMADGYAAMFSDLYAYNIEGYNTINSIINKWAPPSDNIDPDTNHPQTLQYIINVSNATGIEPDQPVSYAFPDDMVGIVTEISTQENGIAANTNDVMNGYNLFVSEYPTE